LTGTDNEVIAGSIVAADPLKEAEELLRLIDDGKLDELGALLALADLESRVSAAREILTTAKDDHT